MLKRTMILRRLIPVLLATMVATVSCDTRGSGIIGVVKPLSGLTSLTLSAGTLAPTFNQAVGSYTASVPNSVNTITVTAVSATTGSTININGNIVASGQASPPLGLQIGPNTINVAVTAADGITTRNYAILVTRQA